MYSCLITILFFLTKFHFSLSNFETFQLDLETNNIVPIEISNRKSLQNNRILNCDMEDILTSVGLNEIQEIIEAMAAQKGTTALAILRMLQKRLKNREDFPESFNTVETASIPEIKKLTLGMPPVGNNVLYNVPPVNQLRNEGSSDIMIVPVDHTNTLSHPLTKVDYLSRMDLFNSSPFQGILPNPPSHRMRPPFGATVRVEFNDPINLINRDMQVALSPLMTVIEVLRQAEIKYQNALGLNHETNVISFAHSSLLDCYKVNQINGMRSNDEFAWKMTIIDRENQVMYENFCLPSGRDVYVKPGSLISLSYVPL